MLSNIQKAFNHFGVKLGAVAGIGGMVTTALAQMPQAAAKTIYDAVAGDPRYANSYGLTEDAGYPPSVLGFGHGDARYLDFQQVIAEGNKCYLFQPGKAAEAPSTFSNGSPAIPDQLLPIKDSVCQFLYPDKFPTDTVHLSIVDKTIQTGMPHSWDSVLNKTATVVAKAPAATVKKTALVAQEAGNQTSSAVYNTFPSPTDVHTIAANDGGLTQHFMAYADTGADQAAQQAPTFLQAISEPVVAGVIAAVISGGLGAYLFLLHRHCKKHRAPQPTAA